MEGEKLVAKKNTEKQWRTHKRGITLQECNKFFFLLHYRSFLWWLHWGFACGYTKKLIHLFSVLRGLALESAFMIWTPHFDPQKIVIPQQWQRQSDDELNYLTKVVFMKNSSRFLSLWKQFTLLFPALHKNYGISEEEISK